MTWGSTSTNRSYEKRQKAKKERAAQEAERRAKLATATDGEKLRQVKDALRLAISYLTDAADHTCMCHKARNRARHLQMILDRFKS